MATRITGMGISFSQFSDVLRSPRQGGGYSQLRGRVSSASGKSEGRQLQSGYRGTPVEKTPPWYPHTIPSCLGLFPLPSAGTLALPPPHPLAPLSLFQTDVFSLKWFFFFLPHKTLRSRADHRLDRELGFLLAPCYLPASLH